MRILFITTAVTMTALLYMSANAQQYLEGRVTRSDVVERPTMTALLQSEFKMNTLYDKLGKQLDDAAKAKLSVAQKSWKKYSQAECDFTVNYSPTEPLHPMSYNECLMVMNTERAAEFQYQLQWVDLLNPGISLDKNELDR